MATTLPALEHLFFLMGFYHQETMGLISGFEKDKPAANFKQVPITNK